MSHWGHHWLCAHTFNTVSGRGCQVRFLLSLSTCTLVADHRDASSVGLLYLWSADSIRKGTANGLEGALGQSGFTLLPKSHARLNDVGATAALLMQVLRLCCSSHLSPVSRRDPFLRSSLQRLRLLVSTMVARCTMSATTRHEEYIHFSEQMRSFRFQ